VRTLIADDHDLFRSGLLRTFQRHPRVDVVAVCTDGTQALERIRATRPRIALVDLRMPLLDGLQIAREVAADPSLRGVYVVLLSARCDEALTLAAYRAGAADCLDKASSRTELCAAVLRVADHGRAPAPSEVDPRA
jgi:two-component system nitrate/nitrite response regulator NarL